MEPTSYAGACGCDPEIIGYKVKTFPDGTYEKGDPVYAECAKDEKRGLPSGRKDECQPMQMAWQQFIPPGGGAPVVTPYLSTEHCKKDESRGLEKGRTGDCKKEIIGYKQTLFSNGREPKIEPIYSDCNTKGPRGKDGQDGKPADSKNRCGSKGRDGNNGRNL